MPLTLHNTLSRTKELFSPLNEDSIGMYVCGPTVYDRAHIGNARAVVVFDCLYRILKHLYPTVTYVRNITDVDDKINQAALDQGISIRELTQKTTEMFHSDMASLHCLAPTQEPRATEHIDGMISMIETLIAQGYAYAKEGHVLFNTTRYKQYGSLSNRSLDEMVAGARVEVAPYKENSTDFVLWKPSSAEEPGWESPWGNGRPGWHIECSVMSTQYLGETFDIHGGGADLQFPHHENEIAQSCAAHPGSHYARFWVHNGFLTVNGEKMSKSLGNFITVHDLLDQGVQGEVIRFALLSTHYRKPLDWNDKAVSDAKKAVDGFYRALEGYTPTKQPTPPADFMTALSDDMNTPLAIACMHSHLSEFRKNNTPESLDALFAMGQLLGFFNSTAEAWFHQQQPSVNVEHIEELLIKRKTAREQKDWAESDRIRDMLAEENIILEDNPDGTTTWRQA